LRTINRVIGVTRLGCTIVHNMLGAENDIVILTTTLFNSYRELGSMTQPELINVATSSNTKLIIVDDAAGTFVGSCRTSERIYDFVASRGRCIRQSIKKNLDLMGEDIKTIFQSYLTECGE
jgi:hypothetical protein